MLNWALIFLTAALVSAAFGFGVFTTTSVVTAQILSGLFAVLFVGALARRKSSD